MKLTIFEAQTILSKQLGLDVAIDTSEIYTAQKIHIKETKGNEYLNLVSDAITIPKTTGENYIAKADDTFQSYIDSDFKNWKLDKVSEARPETKLGVYELVKNGIYNDIFTSMSGYLDALCLTQHQIIEFCKAHEDLLSKDCATMFLFKENDKFFVANVYLISDGLYVRVYELANDYVWRAEHRFRVVLPQLTL